MTFQRTPCDILGLRFSTFISPHYYIDRPTWRSYFSTDPFLYNFNNSTYFCIRPRITQKVFM